MFENLFKKKETIPKVNIDFPEIPTEKRHTVKVIRMASIDDVANVNAAMARVDALLVEIRDFKDVEELKRSIARIKLAAAKYSGEVVGLDNNWLIVTSKLAELHR